VADNDAVMESARAIRPAKFRPAVGNGDASRAICYLHGRHHTTSPSEELTPPMELEHPFGANAGPHLHGMPQLHCSGGSP